MATGLGRVTFSGALPSGESFNYNLWLIPSAGGTVSASQLATAADTFQSTLLTGATPLAALYPSSTTWSAPVARTVVVATGKTDDVAFGSNTHAGTQSGSFSPLPPEVAVCVSLSGSTGSKPIRGRFYLPAPSTTTVDLLGNMTTSALSTFSGALANAFTAIEGATTAFKPVIYSEKLHAAYAATRSSVGNVFDRMGTRRNKLVEARDAVFAS
jgi:hypothetical protein